jgi:NAD(P)-dependent dehydrogenase (short-subunit alcohol dehydrogenase family)
MSLEGSTSLTAVTDGMAERLIASGEFDERALDAARSNIPLRRFGQAVDVAEAVGFLASDCAGSVSGQKLEWTTGSGSEPGAGSRPCDHQARTPAGRAGSGWAASRST